MTAPPPTAASAHRAVGRNLLLNAIGMTLPVAASLVALPLMLRGFGVDRFGVLSLLLAALAYISLLDLGLGAALTYRLSHMLHRHRRREQRTHAVIRTATAAAAIAGALVGVASAIASPWLCRLMVGDHSPFLAEAIGCLRLLAASLPAVFVGAVLSGALTAHEAFDKLNHTRIPSGVLCAAAPAVAAMTGASLAFAAGLLLATRIGFALVQGWQCAGMLPGLWGDRVKRRFCVREFRALMHFGGWTTISSVVSPLMVYMDRFYLASARSPSQVAEYVTAYELASKLLFLAGLVVPVFFPVLIGARRRGAAESAELLLRLAASLALACSVPAALMAVLAPELIAWWLGGMLPPVTASAMQIICAGALVNCISQAFFLQVQTLGRTRAIAMVHLGVLPGYVLLLRYAAAHFGTQGVAIAWSLRALVDASLFCWMAGATLDAPSRKTLWGMFLGTVLFGLALAALCLVPALSVRAWVLTGPVLVAAAWRQQIWDLAKKALPTGWFAQCRH